jgi:galactose mutarotase-like enzyme
LTLSGVTQVKLDAVHGRDDLSESDVVSWPGAIGGISDRFTFPETGSWAIKFFGDLTGESTLTVTDPRKGERLEMIVRAAEVPQVGVWINCRGWAPPGRKPYFNLALEPCIGAPDRLDVAVSSWHTAQILEPGEERAWSVEVRLPA